MGISYKTVLKDYPDVLTIKQMCDALGISTKTGYKLLKNNEIASIKVGKKYRIAKAHLLKFLNI